ncbi:MAG: polysaccharide deacetylase family protein [Treponema sp.]|jgi:peptidoglycan/xylan/chitin deacetylase (PgdA/CDA1 family)|nr:polysaccharide deacetylase family protein [Treponema sp.]
MTFFFVLGCCWFYVSCKSVPPGVPPEEPPPPAGFKPEPEAESPEPDAPIDRIIQRVSRRAGDIIVYFVLDDDAGIVVKADVREGDDEFEVVYDLQHAVPGGPSQFTVPFSVEERSTGNRKSGALAWAVTEGLPGIALAFDDDYEQVWEQYFDLFDRYGAKVTFFITGNFSAFCAEALNRGHDIGYHTVRHLNLTKVSREDFFKETLSALDLFRMAGIPLRAFAYPYGLWEPWMHEALYPYYGILRGFGTTYRVYPLETIGNGYLSSKSIDNTIYKKDEDFEAAVTMMFRTVKFISGDYVLPITTHTIADDAAWGITPRRLEYLLQTAGDLKLKFYRYGDF